jgi:enamine deaminase RidA (YjgF/YER057c/UK114 family)
LAPWHLAPWHHYNTRHMTLINPPDLPAPRGYSNGLIAQGRLLFVAGQIGWTDRAVLISNRFADQFDQALANVLSVVRAGGGAPESVARLTIFVTDKSEYLSAQAEIGERYRIRMGRHYPPMTLVEVKSLLEPGALVEIEATAVI